MAIKTISELKTEVNQTINTNGNRGITGSSLNTAMIDTIDSLNAIDESLEERKANIDGSYDTLTVGLAKNLEGDIYVEGKTYFKPTATVVDDEGAFTSEEVGSGPASIETIGGNTVVWNQLLKEGRLVDMGLPSGLLWANANIDITQEDGFAASPFQYGCTMFSWGNIEGYNTPASGTTFDYNWGSVNAQEPWYEGQVYGSTPGAALNTSIVAGDTQDAARYNLGSLFKMPTSEQIRELFNGSIYIDATGTEIPAETTDKRVTVNGIVGLYLQSKTNGNRLFFACSGNGYNSYWESRGSVGKYWTASFASARFSYVLEFGSSGIYTQNVTSRSVGCAVRAVVDPSNTPTTGHSDHKYIETGDNMFDLTQMFGAGNEPSTVEEFEDWLSKNVGLAPYYAYNAGTLINAKPTGMASIGYNLMELEGSTGTARVPGKYDDGLYGSYYGIRGSYSSVSFVPAATGISETITPDADGKFEITVPGDIVVSGAGSSTTVFMWYDGSYTKANIEYERNEYSGLDVTKIYGKANGSSTYEQVFPGGLKSFDDSRDILDLRNGEATVGVGRVDNLGGYTWVKQGNLYTTSEVVPDNTNMISGRGTALKWNQYFNIFNTDKTKTVNNLTCTDNRDGSYTLNGTTTGSFWFDMPSQSNATIIPGHKYLMWTESPANSNVGNAYIGAGSGAAGVRHYFKNSYGTICTCIVSTESFGIECASGAVFDNYKIWPMLIDLTLLNPTLAAKPDLTVADVKTFLGGSAAPDYYQYDSGSLGIISDTNYQDAAAFKTAMANVPMQYKLDSPIQYTDLIVSNDGGETGTPVQVFNYTVNNWGLEELLPQNDYATVNGMATTAPILNVKYSIDAVEAINTLNDEVADLYESKANTEGYYPELSVGLADNLKGNDVVTEEFFVHTSGGEAEVANGTASLDGVKGNSVKWNQLIQNGDFSNGTTGWGYVNATISVEGNILSAVAGNGSNQRQLFLYTNPNVIVGHTYLTALKIKPPKSCKIRLAGVTGRSFIPTISVSANVWNNVTNIISDSGNIDEFSLYFDYNSSLLSGDVVQIKDIQLIDLTAMFGTGNEPSTVAEFEEWLAENIGTQSYYPFNEGQVLNVNMTGLESTGFNLLNPQTHTAEIPGIYTEDYDNYYGIIGTYTSVTFSFAATGVVEDITSDIDEEGKVLIEEPGTITVIGGDSTTCVFLWWDGSQTESEPYETPSVARIDVSHIKGTVIDNSSTEVVFPYGMCGIGDIKDEILVEDGVVKAIKRIGVRAYTSGDVDSETMITDGTTTCYVLETPVEYTSLQYEGSSYFSNGTAVTLPINYTVNNWGLERILPINTTSAILTAKPTVTCEYATDVLETINTINDEIDNLKEEKANVKGAYPNMTVGNLISDASIPRQFYYNRTAGEGNEIGSGYANVNDIKGNTIVWNQLLKNGNFTTTDYWYYGSGTFSVDNNIGTLLQSTDYSGLSQNDIAMVDGHKYLLSVSYKANFKPLVIQTRTAGSGGGGSISINLDDFVADTWFEKSVIGTANGDRAFGAYFGIMNDGAYISLKNVSIIDLTQMFGAGNEPNTTEQFETMFPSDYYPYNAGTLISLNPTAVVSTGFNQWDEQWEVGSLNVSTGEKVSGDNCRSKNYIPVIPNTQYYYNGNRKAVIICYYDSSKIFISSTEVNNAIASTPVNARYILFRMAYSYGTTYNHDICINLSDPNRNGTYLPYTTDSTNLSWISGITYTPEGETTPVQLFPNGLCSAGTVYDEVTPTKAIKRIGGDNNLGSHEYVKQGNLYTTSEVVPDNANMISSGGTALRWNQLLNKEYFKETTTLLELTITNNGDGSFTLNGTPTNDVWFLYTNKNVTLIYGHKYLYKGCPAGGSSWTYCLWDGNGYLKVDAGEGRITDYTAHGIPAYSIVVRSGVQCNNLIFRPQLIDLTLLFGKGNEPTTVAEFKTLMGGASMLDYYAYDTGHLGIINDGGYATAAAFKEAMANVPMYYELETPIEVPINHTIEYAVQPGGTEQLLPENTPSATPTTSEIIMDVTYPLDAVGTIQNLPSNYISSESMTAFINAINSANVGFTVTMTYNSETGKYTFTVTPTQQTT